MHKRERKEGESREEERGKRGILKRKDGYQEKEDGGGDTYEGKNENMTSGKEKKWWGERWRREK